MICIKDKVVKKLWCNIHFRIILKKLIYIRSEGRINKIIVITFSLRKK